MDHIPPIAYMAMSIPIISIILGIGTAWYKQWLDFKREAMRLKASSSAAFSQAQSADIELLRKEIMQLRDTTTQYDMSVERTLNDIKQRLAHIENGGLPARQTGQFTENK